MNDNFMKEIVNIITEEWMKEATNPADLPNDEVIAIAATRIIRLLDQSVVPLWVMQLPMQQQSVLFLALRGPDGVRKHHPMKNIQRAYRGSVIKGAHSGRELTEADEGDSFMKLKGIYYPNEWAVSITDYFNTIDELPHHFHNHLMHGAQILAYKHPDTTLRQRWLWFYNKCVDDAHLNPETEEEMDKRLNDGGRNAKDTR